MKLMRLGPVGAERPVVRIDDTTYVDVSDAVTDYDEAFFGSGVLVVVAHPDLTARDAVDAVEQGFVGRERHPVGKAQVVVEHGGRVPVRPQQPLRVPRPRDGRGADQEAS